MSNTCNFEVGGLCYAPKCFGDIRCEAKVDGKIVKANDEEINLRSKRVYGGIIGMGGIKPKMVVMQPTVVNTSENVATEGFDSEAGVILKKIDSFDFDNREDGK